MQYGHTHYILWVCFCPPCKSYSVWLYPKKGTLNNEQVEYLIKKIKTSHNFLPLLDINLVPSHSLLLLGEPAPGHTLTSGRLVKILESKRQSDNLWQATRGCGVCTDHTCSQTTKLKRLIAYEKETEVGSMVMGTGLYLAKRGSYGITSS